ncbi:MAG: leucine--tRNA ligase [Limnothrix sp. RL_2_0]|nr:leucine--tRNA ligase [Limnothrix sp. RL_2_0]
METRYSAADIEAKWQQQWLELGLDQTPAKNDQPKFYALSMFPYPSGKLHMGHVRNYVITDVIARYKRMKGFRVLHPMGWDAFGLPAENAAIDRGIPPAKWTYQNIEQMRDQLKQLGLSIDWDREVATCSPDYYKWTQWLFLQFYKGGLAYQKEAAVNWDPIDQTVLANEQVDAEGKSWRSGAIVEKKLLRQWFLKITDYAEELLQDLDKLGGWPERVKTMQQNWIGKSSGAHLEFPIVDSDEKIAVFTTRPDTIYGVTYVVLAPEHPLVAKVTTAKQKATVDAFIEEVSKESEQDRTADDKPKKGVLTGGTVINPANGEEVPILIANYVLYEYGTGAVMGVPAHDARDFKFAEENNLPRKVVILPDDADNSDICLLEAYTDAGTMINSNRFNGMSSVKGKSAVIRYAESEGFGEERIQYRLRDWLISRQRYWGCPIPMIYCDDCGVVPVPEENLPVILPEEVEFSARGGSPLAQMDGWKNVDCPCCNKPARRETDTMDTFIDSSWYFLRYTDAKNEEKPFNLDDANDWMGVDQYVGGIEHAILHLLYSRFFTKVVRDRKLVGIDEPFKRLLTQGMVQALTYKNTNTNKYIPIDQIDPEDPQDPETGDPLTGFYEKMSKSKYNGVDPALVLDKYGADTARMFILFKAPPEKDLEWDDADVEGQFRFLNRIWNLVSGCDLSVVKKSSGELSKDEKDLRRAVHTAIKEIQEDLEGDYQFNTAIAELMKLSNALKDAKCVTSPVYIGGIEILLLLLAPFAPHLADELWQSLGHTQSIHTVSFPKLDESALKVDEITLVIQIMGKTRGTIEVPAGSSKEDLEKFARESEAAQRYIEGQEIRKIIVVPNKLVNFVIAK